MASRPYGDNPFNENDARATFFKIHDLSLLEEKGNDAHR
jgi:hypothetical protein